MSWVSTAVGFAAPVVAAVSVAIAYRRSRTLDKVTEQSGVVVESREGTALMIDGLHKFIDQLQDDNKVFREDRTKSDTRLDVVTKERDECRRELANMIRRYGNGTPPKGIPPT